MHFILQVPHNDSLSNLYRIIGIPAFRTRVMYVPQRPSLLPGSPYDFLVKVTSFRAHKTFSHDSSQGSINEVFERAIEIGEQWGIQDDLWRRNWINLSGGEGQRILIAAAVSLNTAEILLLDGKHQQTMRLKRFPLNSSFAEPTSALDAETSLLVENYLVERIKGSDTTLKSLIWITHSPEQSQRVGTRFIHLSGGGCYESDDPNPSPYPNTPVG